MKPSALIFSLFFVLLAVYSLVTLTEPKLNEAAIKFSIILLLSMGVTSIVNTDSFAFTLITPIIALTTICTHYGTAALASLASYNLGLSSIIDETAQLNYMMHDIAGKIGGTDPFSIIGLALLNGVAEEALFTGAGFLILERFTKTKYLAAFLISLVFAIYHTQSYLNVTPFEFLLNISKYSKESLLLLSPFATQVVKCILSDQEAKRGGGLLGVSIGHAIGNGLILLAAYGWV